MSSSEFVNYTVASENVGLEIYRYLDPEDTECVTVDTIFDQYTNMDRNSNIFILHNDNVVVVFLFNMIVSI